jgi:hypothetical protein
VPGVIAPLALAALACQHPASDPGDTAVGAGSEALPPGPLQLRLAFSVHLEGWGLEADSKFESYTETIDQLVAAFDAYGARLSLEGKEVIEASAERRDGTLRRVSGDGHAIGVHADASGGQRDVDARDLALVMRRYRQALETLGMEASHVSGACADTDWVYAIELAGFRTFAGAVAWCAVALDPPLRPPSVRRCESPADCHWQFPEAFGERLHPWRMGSASDWIVHDPQGAVVFVPNAISLPCALEAITDPSATGCEFTEEDIDLYFEALQRALALTGPEQPGVFRTTWSMGQVPDAELLELWLTRLAPYVESGRVAWATVPEVTDAYEAAGSPPPPWRLGAP